MLSDSSLRVTEFYRLAITSPHHHNHADSAAAADTPGQWALQVWQLNVKLLTTDFLAFAAGVAARAPDAIELFGKTPADLARLLDQGAARAHHVDEHVHQHAAGDRLLLTQTPAYHWSEVESEQR